MRRLVCTAVAVCVTIGAHAGTIDFDDFAHGDNVTGVTSDDGIFASITASGGINQAWAFDTGLSNTRDPDLEGPFRHFGGVLGDLSAGRVLIIQENKIAADDNARGGTLTFFFDRLVDFMGFTLIDDATLTVRNDDSNEAFFASMAGKAGENKYEVYGGASGAPLLASVRRLTFALNGSGAIDSLIVREVATPAPVPVPPAIAALLTALGGLAFVSRRRIRV